MMTSYPVCQTVLWSEVSMIEVICILIFLKNICPNKRNNKLQRLHMQRGVNFSCNLTLKPAEVNHQQLSSFLNPSTLSSKCCAPSVAWILKAKPSVLVCSVYLTVDTCFCFHGAGDVTDSGAHTSVEPPYRSCPSAWFTLLSDRPSL